MVNRIKQFIPKIKSHYFINKDLSGIRTSIIQNGAFLHDVLELHDSHSFHILNYNSPGATGAPAYSAYIINKLSNYGYFDIKYMRHSFWNYNDLINHYK